jgi:hypothetical protein
VWVFLGFFLWAGLIVPVYTPYVLRVPYAFLIKPFLFIKKGKSMYVHIYNPTKSYI